MEPLDPSCAGGSEGAGVSGVTLSSAPRAGSREGELAGAGRLCVRAHVFGGEEPRRERQVQGRREGRLGTRGRGKHPQAAGQA